ncbi:HAMP domain-containing sensor histidine kinase [Terrabacter sp. NPDC000476]|uniref:sensor histidine kinase n=1 Tax=Terrabacter sp. NPDC000476 TaxID=3154258 RepID=UPI0033261BFA
MVALLAVLVASIVTAAVVALLVGPPIFHEHLIQAGHAADSPELAHIEEAYRDSSLTSLGIALVVALGCASVVAWYLSRRLQAPLGALTRAAREVSRGHYDRRVAVTGASRELDTLAEAFNTMAERLEQVEDTRRQLLSDLAHEMRTPVATVRAYSEGLQDGVVDWDENVATVLLDQSDRLGRLAEDLDDVSRAEEGRIPLDLRPCRVGDLVWAGADAARAAYQLKGVNLVVDVERASGVSVDVDPQRFGQITANLLGNALRHTPAGGTVSVTAFRDEAEAAIRVTDNGDGISPEQLPHVFERFYRGDTARDRAQGGSGIGLTISKALADALGGSLTATSPGPGEGATFTVTLPTASDGPGTRHVTPAAASQDAPTPEAPPGPRHRTPTPPRPQEML